MKFVLSSTGFYNFMVIAMHSQDLDAAEDPPVDSPDDSASECSDRFELEF